MKAALPAVAVVLGLVLLVASFLWGILFPATKSWTNEQSAQMAEINRKANLLKFALVEAKQNPRMHGGKNPAELQAEYDKLKSEYEVLQQEFSGARDGPKKAASLLRWSGVAFVVAGGLVVMATRSN